MHVFTLSPEQLTLHLSGFGINYAGFHRLGADQLFQNEATCAREESIKTLK